MSFRLKILKQQQEQEQQQQQQQKKRKQRLYGLLSYGKNDARGHE
jgi:hypothetical protein